MIWNKNNFSPSIKSYTESQLVNKLRSADYSTEFRNVGENMNITLHQSYLNTSFNTIVNNSIVNGNDFTLPCPTDVYFNSSYTNITMKNIIAPNKTLDIETNPVFNYSFVVPLYTSFEVLTTCYLNAVNISIFAPVGGSTFDYDVFSAKFDSGDIKPDADLTTGASDLGSIVNDSISIVWLKLSGLNQLLNVSETYNNVFFIKITASDTLNSTWSADVNGDDTLSYQNPLDSPLAGIDLTLCVDLSPLNNTPKPSEINLKINNNEVTDLDQGSGYWESTKENSNDSGYLHYNITADWWDVECNVSQVQINFTRTDLLATSEFNIAGSGQLVEWNVTRNGGLNYFYTGFDNYQINFTIPEAWVNPSIRVFNGESDERTSTITKRLLGNNYREINVPNAGNGTYWFLIANSTNLLTSIDSYNDLSSANTFNFTDIVHFNATFSKEISDGVINLSVYSPAIINDELNYSIKTQSFLTGSEISLTNWDVSSDVTQYGVFRVQVYWNNNTDAGFRETTITILGETQLIPNLPASIFDASDFFNIEVYFNDTGLIQGIESATITYQIESGPIRTDNVSFLGNGYYNITIGCNDTDFGANGPNLITINTSKSFYNNQSGVVEATILGETALYASISKQSFNSTETFNVSLFFNDTVKGLGLDNATIEVFVNSTLYNNAIITPFGGGDYNITVDCDDDVFDDLDYGFFNLGINFVKSYYYNQTTFFIIIITGETSLSASKFPVPSKGYYNSEETFNITVYLEDIGKNEGINGGQVKVYVKEVSSSTYQEYITVINPFGTGYYNFTVNCSDIKFSNYGKYNIKVNVTKANYYTASNLLEELIIGTTTLTILNPTGTLAYDEDEVLYIIVKYEDHVKTTGITGADVRYSFNGTELGNLTENLNGTYTIAINLSNSIFGSNYGNVNITILANKTNYINLTRTLNFERRILTTIKPTNTPSLMQVTKGTSIFFTFKYSDKLGNPIDTYDVFENATSLQNFGWSVINNGVGNYTLEMNTSQVIAVPTPYTLNFSIYAFGNQSQEFSFTILITVIQTRLEIDSWNDYADFARSTIFNISIDFYFNDTTNNQPITGLTNGDIIVNNYNTGTLWSPGFELFNRVGDGNYKLNISTAGVDSGLYTLELKISKFPNYNWSIAQIQFSLRGNYTQIHLISVSDPGGQIAPQGLNNFTIFEGSDVNVEFNVTDLEYANALVLGDADTYSIWAENPLFVINYTLLHNLNFVYQTPSIGTHVGSISTSNALLTPGNYFIHIAITKSNYESMFFTFNLTVIARHQVRLNVMKPVTVDAGDAFFIVVKAEYFNGTDWMVLVGAPVSITPYFDGVAATPILFITNSTGEAVFPITSRIDAINMTLSIELQGTYYSLDETLETSISIIGGAPIPGIDLQDFIPYIIIIGAVIAVAAGSIIIYRRIIIPKKRKMPRVLEGDIPKKRKMPRVLEGDKTILDDPINLEHLFVLFKKTGTCIFYKSFVSEEIHPILISGFISEICSFSKDLNYQEKVNKITSDDKTLLVSDGEYVRVALILSEEVSTIFHRNLIEFVNSFEKNYANELQNWGWQFNVFINAGTIIDEKLNISINLPHEIAYDISSIKPLRNPYSKDVLKIANEFVEESGRNFLPITTLLEEVTEKTQRDTTEILLGIMELRDKKILIPIEMPTIEAQPITQEEMTVIDQKVAKLANLAPEEKKKLVANLAQVGPAERKVYLASLMEQHEIISAPIEEKLGVTIIDNVKIAKKDIKDLQKIAQLARNEKDYEKAINIYRKALRIATEYELARELDQIKELLHSTESENNFNLQKD